MANFSHSWQTPLDVHRTWRLITEALENSARSPIWPNELSEVHASSGTALAQGTPLSVIYKFGSFKTEAHYQIKRFDAPRILQYESTDQHPLKGYAVITLNATQEGGTHCMWTGIYQPKGVSSAAPLIWFKLYYERRFFKKFIENFETYVEGTGGRDRAA